jgi:hypothetical protein
MIIITTSAFHTPKKWPGFMERGRKRAIPPTLTMKKLNGDVVESFNLGDERTHPWPSTDRSYTKCSMNMLPSLGLR